LPIFALSQAAYAGQMDMLKLMTDKVSNIYKHWSDRKRTYNDALDKAASGGHIKAIQFLLDLGADSYDWAMANAAAVGNTDIVKFFLEKGAYPNIALEEAVREGYIDIVELLLEAGATNLQSTLKVAEDTKRDDIADL